ncbi:MAG: tail fiber domain-containing protein [Verrucomicrobiota bacterium]
MKRSSTLLIAFLAFTPSLLPAQTVPLFMSYQGRVTDNAGAGIGTASTPVNRKVVFRLYDAATGGTRLWTEEQTVTLVDGEFSVLLGNGINVTGESRDALDTVFTKSGTGRFLGVTVDGGDNVINVSDTEISPRQQLASTAYAFRARAADTIAPASDLLFGGSPNDGLGWYGTGRLFNGITVNGPVLYGAGGGVLGVVDGSTRTSVLRWDKNGKVGIGTGSADLSITGSTKLVLQGDDTTSTPQQLTIRGGTDPNKRLILGYGTTSDYGAIQAFNGATSSTAAKLMINPSGGNVGIGKTSAGSALDVNGTVTATTFSGSGSGITGLDASKLGTGSIPDARLSSNVALLGGTQAFTGANQFASVGIGTGPNSAKGALLVNGDYYGKGHLWLNAVEGDGKSGTAYIQARDDNKDTSIGMVLRTKKAAALNDVITLTSDGNAGIGTGTPAAKLDVAGGINASGGISVDGDNGYSFNSGGGDTDGGLFSPADGTLTLRTDSAERLRVTSSGNVGIGTGDPKAKLHVNGSVNYTMYKGGQFEWYQTSTATFLINAKTDSNAHEEPASIYASNDILCSGFWSFSDERIKNIIGPSDGGRDLRALQGIAIMDYTLKDTVKHGRQHYKKVIAQQVEKVYPEAVTRSTGIVPDILRPAGCQEGWVDLDTDLKKGERVRLIGEKAEGVHEVLETAPGGFRTEFKPEDGKVFVYGREVNDFRTVDYEAIAMLNVSATQEIYRKLEAEKAKVAALTERLDALEVRDRERDAKFAVFEKLLRSVSSTADLNKASQAGGSAARPVLLNREAAAAATAGE